MDSLSDKFIAEYGSDVYDAVRHHAGSHAVNNGVQKEKIPEKEEKEFLYGLIEAAEYECGTEGSKCCFTISDDDVFRFILSNHSEIADKIECLPSRGIEKRDDLDLIYPLGDLMDIQVEIESGTRPQRIKTHVTVGHDLRDESRPFVCLIPVDKSMDPSEVPDAFPVIDDEPDFGDDIDTPVEIVVPVETGVWKISAVVSPGFMTLDGWDYRTGEPVSVQIGIVEEQRPNASKLLLDRLSGDWKP